MLKKKETYLFLKRVQRLVKPGLWGMFTIKASQVIYPIGSSAHGGRGAIHWGDPGVFIDRLGLRCAWPGYRSGWILDISKCTYA